MTLSSRLRLPNAVRPDTGRVCSRAQATGTTDGRGYLVTVTTPAGGRRSGHPDGGHATTAPTAVGAGEPFAVAWVEGGGGGWS
jgi:hypothetical protein